MPATQHPIQNEFLYFSGPKTNQGSYRSFAHGWTGAHAIAEGVRLLLQKKSVEFHICGHNVADDNETYYVMKVAIEKSYVQGRSHELRTQGNGSYSICGTDPVEMASHLAMHLYSRCEKNQCIHRQPTTEEVNEMGLE